MNFKEVERISSSLKREYNSKISKIKHFTSEKIDFHISKFESVIDKNLTNSFEGFLITMKNHLEDIRNKNTFTG